MSTIHLSPAALERSVFAYSPALVALPSLTVLVEPNHYPTQHQWIRRMQRLSLRFDKQELDFEFTEWGR